MCEWIYEPVTCRYRNDEVKLNVLCGLMGVPACIPSPPPSRPRMRPRSRSSRSRFSSTRLIFSLLLVKARVNRIREPRRCRAFVCHLPGRSGGRPAGRAPEPVPDVSIVHH